MSSSTAMRTEFGSEAEEAARSFRTGHFDKYYGCDDVTEIETDTRKINTGKQQVWGCRETAGLGVSRNSRSGGAEEEIDLEQGNIILKWISKIGLGVFNGFRWVELGRVLGLYER
jgi:hypothetical protein